MAGASKQKRLQQRKRKRIPNDAVQYDQPEIANENPKGRFLFKLLIRVTVILALIGCTASIISLQSTIAERKAELETLRSQTETYEAENEDLERVLNSGDVDTYMERLAREEYGYAYPDEYRFYDTSRN
jgi:cell division protein FtsB